ncbi:MAG TPA: NUDIX domain-containing protein [Candidatus Saccharimonadia bacterium]|nr:NUDIX domain-containing protein [Candidatus Saccharimonadia bacterium]
MSDLDRIDPMSIGSKGLVFVGDMLLVHRRTADARHYPSAIDLPGGGPEPGETPFATFKREVKEEFALDITRPDIVWARCYTSSQYPDRTAHFPVVKLPASAREHIKLSTESTEYMLMPVADYLALPAAAWPILQQRTRDYLQASKRSK